MKVFTYFLGLLPFLCLTNAFTSELLSYQRSRNTQNIIKQHKNNKYLSIISSCGKRTQSNYKPLYLTSGALFESKSPESRRTESLAPTARRPSVESGLRYKSDDWLRSFLSIPNSFVLRRIIFHLLTNTAVAILVTILNKLKFIQFSIPLVGHSLLGGFMSLLLAYRTNSAYARFWEARGLWSSAYATCRNLAMLLLVHISPHSPQSAQRILDLLEVYPDALCDTCLCGSTPLSISVSNVLNQSNRLEADKMFDKPFPLEPGVLLCHEMQKALHEAADESVTSGSNYLEALHLNEACHEVAMLVTIMTNCRKIARTPGKQLFCVGCSSFVPYLQLFLTHRLFQLTFLPFLPPYSPFQNVLVPLSYSRHTSRFLTIWCGTLPIALVKNLGWYTTPVVIVACWCLFGIEEIGHLIEQPFIPSGAVSNENKKIEEGKKRKSVEKNALQRRAEKTQPYDIGLPIGQFAGYIREEIRQLVTWNENYC